MSLPSAPSRALTSREWLMLAGALLLLNAVVAFRNIWPTPAFWWAGDLSVELAVLLAGLTSLRQTPSQAAVWWLALLWTVLAALHYVDVTTPALLGREVNLFWDVRYLGDVVAMFVAAAAWWVLVLGSLVAIGTAGVLVAAIRWALDRVAHAVTRPRTRRAVRAGALATLALFVTSRGGGVWSRTEPPEGGRFFARPALDVLAQQARLMAAALGEHRVSPPGPPALRSDLSLVEGADVLLLFMESYGAVTWQRPAFIDRLAASRAALTSAVRASGKEIVSAYVESPTFGGSSWFAHISLLSGVEVKDPTANALLMNEERETLVTTFARGGYRTVALMPGLWQPWPEGAFYAFQEVYGGERLAYKGPQFGWWAIPDQFSLAQLASRELGSGERAPVFAFFPTVSTHTPFAPAPLYQPNWARVLTDTPFDEREVIERFDEQPDWTNLSPSYADAVAYAHTALGGFFGQPMARDFVMVWLGDHQPPALVTGPGATWNVPVHVIAGRSDVLDRLRAQGFEHGLEPRGAAIGRMHELLPVLLDSFGDRRPPPTVQARK